MKTNFSVLFLFIISILLFACGQKPAVSLSPIPPTLTLPSPTMILPTDTSTPVAEILTGPRSEVLDNNPYYYDALDQSGLDGSLIDGNTVRLYDLGEGAIWFTARTKDGKSYNLVSYGVDEYGTSTLPNW